MFVDLKYTFSNSALGPNNYVLGINIPDLTPQDNSTIAIPMANQCNLNRVRSDYNICERASIGHPNPLDALRYYDQILAKSIIVVA